MDRAARNMDEFAEGCGDLELDAHGGRARPRNVSSRLYPLAVHVRPAASSLPSRAALREDCKENVASATVASAAMRWCRVRALDGCDDVCVPRRGALGRHSAGAVARGLARDVGAGPPDVPAAQG